MRFEGPVHRKRAPLQAELAPTSILRPPALALRPRLSLAPNVRRNQPYLPTSALPAILRGADPDVDADIETMLSFLAGAKRGIVR